MSTSRYPRWKTIALRSWLPIALLAIWWFASDGSKSLYFPSLRSILSTLRTDWIGPAFTEHLLPSVVNFGIGFVIATLLGIALGTVIGLSPTLRGLADPIIQFVRSIPPPALLPFSLMLFGIGATMNIAVIVLGAIWPTLLNTVDGVRSVDPQVRDVARSYRLTFAQRIHYVLLPSAAPQIFAGIRTTLRLSIILIVVSEMVAATHGIGYYLLSSQQTFAVPQTWAATIVLGILGYLANLIFLAVERHILRWHYDLNDLATKG